MELNLNIIILDGFTLNPGDLSWKPLQELGTLTVYDRTPVPEVATRGKNAHILLTNKTRVSREAIQQIPHLRYIGELATGFDNIDIVSAREKGVPVCNVPGYGSDAVAQFTWACILELTYGIGKRSESVHRGEWAAQKDFCYGHQSLFELAGKTLGLVGLGQIGSRVGKIGAAFGMRIIAVVNDASKHRSDGIELVSLEECFQQGDFVSLHCPLTENNREMVNSKLLALMKQSAFLVNTSRGALINENDLAQALIKNQIAGAAIDVLSKEPPTDENPLLLAPRCIITPHIAWATKESRQRLLDASIENIKSFLSGHPKNVVN